MLYRYRQNIWILTNIYKDIVEDLKTRFDTSNFEIDRPLPKGKNKKVIAFIKNELDEQIVTEFIGLRGRMYIYLKGSNNE